MSDDQIGEPKYVVSGRLFVKTGGDTLAEAVKAYREEYGGMWPDGYERTDVDEGAGIMGPCEDCGRPILDSEEYWTDGEVRVCRGCPHPGDDTRFD